MTVISYGGGVQSTAMLVLAAQGKLNIDAALFANVGDDSEDPRSLRYVREVAKPYAAAHGIPVHELHRTTRDGTRDTILGRITRDGSRSHTIPVRLSSGKPGGRSCTADFKVSVTGRWLREQGATADDPATVLLGISLDEIHRANPSRANRHERLVYPLLDLGMNRADCQRLIADAGLPIPGKSACWFCPNRRLDQWAAMRANEPGTWQMCVDLERHFIDRERRAGREPVYLSNAGVPLPEAVPDGVQTLPIWAEGDDSGECDNGWCMT
ncbi:phosphoadenosine phosphosulfate reductase [Saccharomonospora piscinae]|uniref:Phosphoadenosine phosphosulfate reductase n=1 Tax=Saccharomonospora piscinae TaxID=687388 RepID=A0A1V8ZZ23_SACPI|nr:phosphoadenosine phosphosulfate reductase [Saccharomonospora piscinae]